MSAMNWLLKLFGHRAREYRGDAFSVRIKPIFREAVSVIYTRRDKTLNFGGERIGRKWQGISVQLAADLEESQVAQIVRDLETAFVALQYGFVITRKIAVDIVPSDSFARYSKFFSRRSRFQAVFLLRVLPPPSPVAGCSGF
jgi:hypothetical protein